MPAGFQLPQPIHLLEVFFGGVVLLRLQEFLDPIVRLDVVGLHEILQVSDVSVPEEDEGVLSVVGLIFLFWVQPRPVVFLPPGSDDSLGFFCLSGAALGRRIFWLSVYWRPNGNVCSWRHFRVHQLIVVDLMQGVSLLWEELRVQLVRLPLICLPYDL